MLLQPRQPESRTARILSGDDDMDPASFPGSRVSRACSTRGRWSSFPAHPGRRAMPAICRFTKIRAGQHVPTTEDPYHPTYATSLPSSAGHADSARNGRLCYAGKSGRKSIPEARSRASSGAERVPHGDVKPGSCEEVPEEQLGPARRHHAKPPGKCPTPLLTPMALMGAFEVNRDRVSVRLLNVSSCGLRCVTGAGSRGCRRCGPGGAGSRGCGTRRPGGPRARRAGSGSRRWRW